MHEAQSAKGKGKKAPAGKGASGGGAKKRKAPSGGEHDREDGEGGERGDDGEWGGRGTPRKSGREPTRRSSRQQGVAADLGPDDLPDDDGARAGRHERGMNATEEEHDEAERDYLRCRKHYSPLSFSTC